MDSLITPFQNAFIQGRTNTDNILMDHEIFDHLGRLERFWWTKNRHEQSL